MLYHPNPSPSWYIIVKIREVQLRLQTLQTWMTEWILSSTRNLGRFLALSRPITVLHLWWFGFLVGVGGLVNSSWSWANVNQLPQELKNVGIQKALGQQVDPNLVFTDSTGEQRQLRNYFDGKRPVLLTLNYFRCPMLCTLQLNGLLQALRDLSTDMDQKFRILTISFDHTEGHTLAHSKQKNYRAQLEKRSLDWDFLVGSQASVQALTQALRYKFQYVPKEKQYAHPAVMYVLTPHGKVSQYLSGIQFKARDLKFSLVTASQGNMGSWMDAMVMSCFVYNPEEGKYTGFAFGIVRLGGGLTVLTLALLLGFFWIRERRRRFHEVESPT